MGYGDELLGSGLARGALARGKRIAFGNGRQIIWHANAHEIYRGNENVAPPGDERAADLDWIAHYAGARTYCRLKPGKSWEFIPGTQRAGELFFTPDEIAFADAIEPGFILIEPNTKQQAPNKRWPYERYREIARLLAAQGYRLAQFVAGGLALDRVDQIKTGSFRLAAAVLQRARLYIGPEGGLHHAAAALDVPAVVIFGGFISPAVTGYATHTNLFSGDGLGCGNIDPCEHCRKAMDRISVDQVYGAAMRLLQE